MTPEECLWTIAERRFDKLDGYSQAAVMAGPSDVASVLSRIEWCEAFEARRREGIAAATAAIMAKVELFYPSIFPSEALAQR